MYTVKDTRPHLHAHTYKEINIYIVIIVILIVAIITQVSFYNIYVHKILYTMLWPLNNTLNTLDSKVPQQTRRYWYSIDVSRLRRVWTENVYLYDI